MAVRRHVRLIVTTRCLGPASGGLIRPMVVIPQVLLADARRDHLRTILAHELVHVRRGDMLVGILQLVARSVWWFHPLIWWANRELNRQREYCCDEEVVAGLSVAPGEYARCLVDVLAAKLDSRPAYGFPLIDPVRVTSMRLRRVMKNPPLFHADTNMVLDRRRAGCAGHASGYGPGGRARWSIGGSRMDGQWTKLLSRGWEVQ